MITTGTRPSSTLDKQSNAKFRVLVVDADRSNCDAISDALRSNGCRINTEHDDPEGLSLCRLRNYAAIVVDLVQSRQGALEVVKLLRRDHTQAAILVLTGKHDFQTRVEAFEAGADDYLASPFSTEQLLDRMMTVIHKKRVDAARTITVADLTIDAKNVLRPGEESKLI